MIEKYFINETGVAEVIMSIETAKMIKIGTYAFFTGYELGAEGRLPSHRMLAEYVADNFLEDEKSKKTAAENYREFIECVDRKVREYIKE